MGGLSFLSPLFLIGALAVAIPVVLHLFRRRDDPVVPFSAMRFLHAVPIEQARRRRLQDLLLLALRVAALLLLALGFARPYLQSPMSASEAGVTVVAVDVSASMGDAVRFGRAKALAQQAIDRAPAGDQVAVAQFAGRADVLVEPGPDRAAARQAIGRVCSPRSGRRAITPPSPARSRWSARGRVGSCWSPICRPQDGPRRTPSVFRLACRLRSQTSGRCRRTSASRRSIGCRRASVSA